MFPVVFDHSTFYLDVFGHYYNNRAIRPDLFATMEDLRRFSYAKSLDRTPVESFCESARRSRWFAVSAPWFLYAQYHLTLNIVGNHADQHAHSTPFLNRLRYAASVAHAAQNTVIRDH